MCGRYALVHPPEDLSEIFGTFGSPPDFPARYNVAPSQPAPVVVGSSQGPRMGLVPWGLPRGKGGLLINARLEGLARQRRFVEPFRTRRCLVPVSGFYEWRVEGATKVPYLIQPASDPVLALAGLWDRTEGGEGQPGFVVITTAPGSFMERLHDRSPLMIPADQWDRWLDPTTDPDGVAAAAAEYEAPRLLGHPVSTHVNRTAHDDPQCVHPVGATLRDDDTVDRSPSPSATLPN